MAAVHSGGGFDSLAPAGTTSRTLHDFEIGKPLGKGHFGRVYLARLKGHDFVLALKALDRGAIEASAGAERQVRREIQVMQGLRHPNIVRLYDYFSDDKNLYLMLEFAGQGELYKQLVKRGRLGEHRSAKYVRQVAAGLDYLHARSVIHRDIKPENLFIGMNGDVKIGDFGWSVHSPKGSQRTFCGTPSYVSPEMVLGQPHGHAVDIWALGVLAFELVTGDEPFKGDSQREIHRRICQSDVRFPSHVSAEAQDIIKKLLQVRPEDRLQLAMVPNHEWIRINE